MLPPFTQLDSSPRMALPASGSNTTGISALPIFLAPSLRSVRRAASRPTSTSSSSSARKRRAAQWKPRRFFPSVSSVSGLTTSDTYEPSP
jgi:hypothetical protein